MAGGIAERAVIPFGIDAGVSGSDYEISKDIVVCIVLDVNSSTRLIALVDGQIGEGRVVGIVACPDAGPVDVFDADAADGIIHRVADPQPRFSRTVRATRRGGVDAVDRDIGNGIYVWCAAAIGYMVIVINFHRIGMEVA